MLILAVDGLAVNGALPLYMVSKSVFYTLYSVNKCRIDSLSVLFQVNNQAVKSDICPMEMFLTNNWTEDCLAMTCEGGTHWPVAKPGASIQASKPRGGPWGQD